MSDTVIADIQRKIARERNIAIGANNLRKETTNALVIERCKTQVREAQKNIDYLTETLKKMTLKKREAQQEPKAGGSVNKPAFTVLDLLKYECPSLGHRIQYMLQLLQFKLQVEEQYRDANEKIYRLYEADGDRKSLALAQEQKVESDRRLQLIMKGLKQYQSLYVDVDEVSRENAVINTYHKNPLTGMLSLTVTAIRNVDHIATSFSDRNPESTIVIKVDDATRATTRAARTDRWNEHFDLEVSQANELSFTVYDKQGGEQIPVAMCWLPLSDVAEEIRRKKVSQQQHSQDWISAEKYQTGAGGGNGGSPVGESGVSSSASSTSTATPSTNPSSSCWFQLEPAGQILVTVSFVKEEKHSRGASGNAFNGLGRHGAIRQRKEEVTEYYGHKFVQRQFYNIMCCAVCGDFLRYTGFQCEDCRFLCHKKCYQNVITKCISKSSAADADDDQATLNHRIPHNFVQVANRGTKWCCHCGYILPWGKKNVRKCADCGVMCHASCAHLVPDFCGISLENAKRILDEINHARERKAVNEARKRSLMGHVQGAQQQIEEARAVQAQAQQRQKQLPEVPLEHGSEALPPLPGTSSVMIPRVEIETEEEARQREEKERREIESRDREERVRALREAEARAREQQAARQRGAAPVAQQTAYPQSAVTSQNPSPQTPETPKGPRGSTSVQGSPSKASGSPSTRHHHHHHRPRRRRHGLDDFRFIAVLGKGNFGKVMLAESVLTRQLCAIKVLKKNFILQNEEVESTKSEKRVFLIANKGRHPFLLNLHQCFQTENRIYFVMEYIAGGDLMWHVQKRRFSQKRAQFYAAEVLLALKFLHENGVVYRDLKLDNILLTASGHIKLADYGLCKENMWYGEKTSTFCGTPELMAPEILKEQGYDKAVDWWAFGVLLYQMLLTKSPFRGEDEDEVFNAIINDEPLYPINMAKEAVDILQRLLTRDPAKRLGGGTADAKEIMAHPYFANINWDDFLNRRVAPPYVPQITDPRDPSCFDEEFTSQAAKLTPVNSILSAGDQEKFRGFTYTNDDSTV